MTYQLILKNGSDICIDEAAFQFIRSEIKKFNDMAQPMGSWWVCDGDGFIISVSEIAAIIRHDVTCKTV